MYLRSQHDYPQVWLKVCWSCFHIMSLSCVYRWLRKYKVMGCVSVLYFLF